MYLALSIVACN